MRLASLVFLPAIAYQCLVIAAAIRFRRAARRPGKRQHQPPVSVLKPVKGLDPNTYAAFASQAQQQYPQFEILFGVRDPADPVVAEIERLRHEHPDADIRLIYTHTDALNGKVGSLIDLAAEAKYPVLVVNDGDIKVDPEYLHNVVEPLANPQTGVVTCPYRAWAHSPASSWEALGIGTDFMLGVLVADWMGVRDYALGATIAVRAEDLRAIGGFEALAEFIADDYQLGNRVAKLGKPTCLCAYTVETALADATWGGVWQHQIRWARTIRLSKPGAYAGVPIQQAGLWLIAALLARSPGVALALLVLRWASAVAASAVFKNKAAARLFWLAPVWDVYAFAIWATSYAGNHAVWRGYRLRLDKSGKILR